MMTLYGTVRDYLKEIQAGSAAVDLEVNNLIARKVTLLLFLSRPLVFKYCLRVPGSNETFNSARWTLLQVFSSTTCSTLYSSNSSIFDITMCLTFSPLPATCTRTQRIALLSVGVYLKSKITPDSSSSTMRHSFSATSSIAASNRCLLPRVSLHAPLLSPILHAFRDIGQHQLTLVTCGTGLSINTLFWVQSSGSGMKDSSTTFEVSSSTLLTLACLSIVFELKD